VEDIEADEERCEPVADDPVVTGPIADRVRPERTRGGDEKRQSARHDDSGEHARRAPEALAPASARDQHGGEKRNRHERELLQQDRGREAGCRVDEARSAREPERENEEEEARRIRRAEPRRLHDERVGGERRADRQAHGERPREGERRRDQPERREQDEEAVVVEGCGEQSPARRGDRRTREVGEVVERLVAGPWAAVAAVEPLDPRAAVVVAVRGLAVEDEVAGDLDLVRGVVGVEPLLRRVAEPGLEQDARSNEQARDQERDDEGAPRGPPLARVRDGDDEDEARGDSRELEEPRVPVPLSERHEGTEHAVRLNLSRVKHPAVLADPRDIDEHEQSQRGEKRRGMDDAASRQPKDFRGPQGSRGGDRPGGWRQFHGVSGQGTTPFGQNLPGRERCRPL